MRRAVSFAAVSAFLAMTGHAAADEILETPLGEGELANARAGFLLPSGVEAQFGAVARTFSDGRLILETHISWAEDGARIEQVLASDALAQSTALPGGYLLRDAHGDTTFAHQFESGGLRNVLLNEASERDIRLDTQLMLTLPGFAETQQGFRADVLAIRIADDVQAAIR